MVFWCSYFLLKSQLQVASLKVICLFFLWLLLVFSSLTMICLSVVVFVFILLGVHWSFKSRGWCLSSVLKSIQILSLHYYFCIILSPLIVGVLTICVLDYLTLSRRSLMPFFFFHFFFSSSEFHTVFLLTCLPVHEPYPLLYAACY